MWIVASLGGNLLVGSERCSSVLTAKAVAARSNVVLEGPRSIAPLRGGEAQAGEKGFRAVFTVVFFSSRLSECLFCE